MKTYVFPGQGSQVKGMGKDLFDEYEKLTKKADDILGYSIKDLCLNNPDRQLNQTQFTQPALFVVNALFYEKKLNDTGEKPDYVAGHSLGEYNALYASGAINFETGLKLVQKRGELMAKATGGGMAAVIGLTQEEIERILLENQLTAIDVANINTPTQIVISGLIEDIKKVESTFKKDKVNYTRLNTSGAFHSRYMNVVGDEFEAYLKEFDFSKIAIPVISNVHARPYEQEDIIKNLNDQITHPVKWSESIRYLMGLGDMEFDEIGRGTVLTRLIRKIQNEAELPIVDSDDESAASEPDEKFEDVQAETPETEEATEADDTVAKKNAGETDGTDDENEASTEEKNADNEPIFTRKNMEELQVEIDAWNSKYPIGTEVKVETYHEIKVTRTEAVILFNQKSVIYLEGHNGYFDLHEVAPV